MKKFACDTSNFLSVDKVSLLHQQTNLEGNAIVIGRDLRLIYLRVEMITTLPANQSVKRVLVLKSA